MKSVMMDSSEQYRCTWVQGVVLDVDSSVVRLRVEDRRGKDGDSQVRNERSCGAWLMNPWIQQPC